MHVRILILIFLAFLSLWGKVLSPEEAFQAQITQNEAGIEVRIELGKDIYLYEEEFKITLYNGEPTLLNPHLDLPQAINYDGYQIYPESLHVKIPWEVLGGFGVKKDSLFGVEVSWQGCSKQGLCYQPMSKKVDFNGANAKNSDSSKEISTSEHDAIALAFENKEAWWILVSFFGFGLLLSLTPCVFPMIPILSSIIVAQGGENLGSKRGFFLAFVYVLAMAVAYTIAGVLAGIFGANIQILLQTPWVIWLFSGVFVLLSLSMFGLYELQLPQFLRQKLAPKNDQKGGIWGIAVMGFLSALIVGPCVAAPLAGALLYIGQSGDALLGGAALFVMSMGMGVPLLLIGASAGKLLPKPGAWMDATKAFFGIMLLALAIWMLERVIPANIALVLYGILAISTAVYMGAFEPSRSGGWWRLWKSFAWIVLLYGAMLFVGGVSKAQNPMNPLEPFVGSSSIGVGEKLDFTYIKSVEELQLAVKNSQKPVMVDFYADWCVNCKELENITFKDPAVRAILDRMTLLKVDVTKNSAEDKRLLEKFNLFGPPGLIFYRGGEELKSMQIVGFVQPRQFEKHLQKVIE